MPENDSYLQSRTTSECLTLARTSNAEIRSVIQRFLQALVLPSNKDEDSWKPISDGHEALSSLLSFDVDLGRPVTRRVYCIVKHPCCPIQSSRYLTSTLLDAMKVSQVSLGHSEQ